MDPARISAGGDVYQRIIAWRRGWVQITIFVIFGTLMLVFSVGILSKFSKEGLVRSGTILLIVIALLYLLSGPFVMDPMFTPQDQMTVHGTIHGILCGLVFLLMPISIFVFLVQVRRVAELLEIENDVLVVMG